MPRWKHRLVVGALVLLACLPLSMASPDPAPTGAPLDETLVDRLLHASGMDDPGERGRLASELQLEASSLLRTLDPGRVNYRHARRLHRTLHRRYLETYDEDADSIGEIIVRHRFNCVSASLFYGLVAEALGYRAEIVEIPGHVFLRLHIGERAVDIESTAPRGFDVDRKLRTFQGLPLTDADDLRWLNLAIHDRPEETGDGLWAVPLEQAVGFAWLNRAWRALGGGQPVAAADAVLAARPYLPDLAERAKGVQSLLTRAFTEAYESGSFEAAYAVSLASLEVYGPSTTIRDRVSAAVIKRVEQLGEGSDPGAAAALLDDVATRLPRTDVRRLERGACPLIVAAAVRLEEWTLARSSARRYSEAEPDPVEARRLLEWVEERRDQSEESGPRGGGDAFPGRAWSGVQR